MQERPVIKIENEAPISSVKASIAAAGMANSLTYAFFHPLSTAVNRVQMHEGCVNSRDELKRVIFLQAHNKGLSAKVVSLFKGSVSALNYKFLSRTLKYAGQREVALRMEDLWGASAASLLGAVHGKSFIHACAGGMMGMIEVALLHPLNTFKTKRQAFDERSIRQLYHTEKFTSFYNGYAMAFARTVPAAFVLFGTNAGVMSYYDIKNPDDASFKHNIIAASCGVILSAIVTNPQDVIMKRAQRLTTSVSSLSLFRETVHAYGLKELYRGIGWSIATSLPKKAVPFALYGFFLRSFNQRFNEECASDNSEVVNESQKVSGKN